VALAAVLAAIGAIAPESGAGMTAVSHSHPWYVAAIIVGAAGVLLAVLGGIVLVVAHSRDASPSLPPPPLAATDEHRAALRMLLERARNAVESDVARGEGDALDQEMFARHFPELHSRLASRDGLHQRQQSAPVALQERFAHELDERGLKKGPYIPEGILKGLTAITRGRALRAELDRPIPAALGTPDAIWRAWGSDHTMAGMVDFNPYGIGGQGNVIAVEDESFPDGYESYAQEMVEPLRQLLVDAQDWDEAREIAAARDAFQDGQDAALVGDIKRELTRPAFPTVEGCPGCE
jgi:hypothetical protein